MAVEAHEALAAGTEAATRGGLDTERRFYAGMAVFFFLTTLAGFIPSSIGKVAAVAAGERPPLPLELHVHAVLMGLWMLLLLVQSLLVAGHRVALHRRLGTTAFVLVPAIVVLMVLTTREPWVLLATLPPVAMPADTVVALKSLVTNLLPTQIQTIVLFPVFVGWALAVRRTDPAAHRRLMLFGTALPMMAAIDRLTGMMGLTTAPASGDSLYLCLLLWLAPAMIFDLWRHGRLHRVWIIGWALVVPCFVVAHLLWGNPWWQATAPALMRHFGVTNW